MTVPLKQLSRVKAASKEIDAVTDQLSAAARKLEVLMQRALADGKIGAGVDAALARANIQQLMVESGYYEVGDNLFGVTYQSLIDKSYQVYKGLYGESLQFADVNVSRLQQIRELDVANFNTITDDTLGGLQRVMVDYQFGATDLKDATARVADLLGPQHKQYAETVVRATAHAFDRITSNEMATAAGLDLFEYVGPDDAVTSEFCAEHVGQVKKWGEWQQISNPGGYPVTIYGGHPNCRHSIVPILGDET